MVHIMSGFCWNVTQNISVKCSAFCTKRGCSGKRLSLGYPNAPNGSSGFMSNPSGFAERLHLGKSRSISKVVGSTAGWLGMKKGNNPLMVTPVGEFLGGGNSNIFYFHPEPWGWFPIWRAYFSKGLKPPTRLMVTREIVNLVLVYVSCGVSLDSTKNYPKTLGWFAIQWS